MGTNAFSVAMHLLLIPDAEPSAALLGAEPADPSPEPGRYELISNCVRQLQDLFSFMPNHNHAKNSSLTSLKTTLQAITAGI